MAMPRISGKAQKIAEKTIPGLNRNISNSSKKSKKPLQKDEVELRIMKINDNLGKD